MAHVVSPSTALAFCTNMSGNVNAQPSVVKARNPWKDNQYWREIRYNKQTWTRWM